MQENKKIPFIKFIPGIAWFFVILVLVTLPGKDIPKISFLEELNFDKVVHMGIFATLTILFCWPFYRSQFSTERRTRYFTIIFLLAVTWGYGTELIQKIWWELGRTYDLFDWAADSIGALIGYIFSRKRFL